MKCNKGFTLIELMIALVIAAILVSIAVPSYTSQVRKSRRTDAKTFLLDIAAREQRFFTEYGRYTSTVVKPSSCTGSACGLNLSSDTSSEGYYQVSVAVSGVGNSTYTLTATPVAAKAQAKDTKCVAFTLTSTGVKGVTGSGTANECW